MFIQRIGIHERRSAGTTEELRLQWLGQGKAGGANRDARYIGQRLLAQPAIIGKNKVEKERGKSLEGRYPRAS
jgi:hypothetical protein